MPQKTAPSLKTIFQVLHKTWYLSKLSLSPNFFTESKIPSYYDNNVVSKDLNFQLLEMSPEKNIKYFERFKPI